MRFTGDKVPRYINCLMHSRCLINMRYYHLPLRKTSTYKTVGNTLFNVSCSPDPMLAFCVCMFSHSVMSSCLGPYGTAAHQSPLSMEFFRQEYWNGLPHPAQGIFPTLGLNLHLLYLEADFLPLCHLRYIRPFPGHDPHVKW